MAYLKPQSPIKNGDDHVYPLTMADQIILADGSRLEQAGVVTAGKLNTARKISLSGNVTGSANFDGSQNITINTSVATAPSTKITTGGSEGQILAVNSDGTISPNSRTIASLGTGATYSLNGTVLTITTL